MNLANKITTLRVLMIPVFVTLFYLLPESHPLPALVFTVAASTDFVDGHIARSRHMISNFGKFMDPLADKILTQAAFILLAEVGKIPGWVVIVILARELSITGFRTLAAAQGITIAASMWGKLKTSSQMVCLVYLLFKDFLIESLAFPQETLLSQILIGLALILTILSGVDYILKNKSVLDLENM